MKRTHKQVIVETAAEYGWQLAESVGNSQWRYWDQRFIKDGSELRVAYDKNDLVKDAEFKKKTKYISGTRIRPQKKLDQVIEILRGPLHNTAELLGLVVRRPGD